MTALPWAESKGDRAVRMAGWTASCGVDGVRARRAGQCRARAMPQLMCVVFHEGPYKTIGDVEFATAGWVDWYNNRRLHSSLGMTPPVEYEQAHYAALNREPQPV